MSDQDKTREQLVSELEELRRRVAGLEDAEAKRKQAEEELHESEWRYRRLVEGVPLPIWQSGANSELIECNHRWGEYTGQTADEAKGHGWMKVIHPDDLPRILEEIREGMAGGEKYQLEYRIRRASDGSYRWHLARGVPLKDEDGTLIGWFGCTTDIEDQRQAEKELAKSKAMLQAAIDCLPFNFFAIGLDGRYMLQNAVSQAHLRGNAIGKLPEEVCRNRHDLAIYQDNNRRAFAGEKVEGEVTLSLGGEERFYYNIVAPIRDGGTLHGILGVNIDITERKQAEAVLQKAHDELERRVEERTAELAKANEELAIFRRFAEASAQGFSMADLDGHLIYVNPALCRMLDEDRPEDRIGQHLSVCYSEESNRRGKQEIEPALIREGYWQGELPILSRQGKSIPTWHNAFVIRDEKGNPLRLAVVITDITERKQAEEALRASEERFRVTFEEAPVGMVIGVGDGVITKVNRAVCRMSGYTQDELVGRHVRDLTYPEDRELSGPLVKRLLAGDIPSFTLEKRYLRKDGQPFWAQATTAMRPRPEREDRFCPGRRGGYY